MRNAWRVLFGLTICMVSCSDASPPPTSQSPSQTGQSRTSAFELGEPSCQPLDGPGYSVTVLAAIGRTGEPVQIRGGVAMSMTDQAGAKSSPVWRIIPEEGSLRVRIEIESSAPPRTLVFTGLEATPPVGDSLVTIAFSRLARKPITIEGGTLSIRSARVSGDAALLTGSVEVAEPLPDGLQVSDVSLSARLGDVGLPPPAFFISSIEDDGVSSSWRFSLPSTDGAESDIAVDVGGMVLQSTEPTTLSVNC